MPAPASGTRQAFCGQCLHPNLPRFHSFWQFPESACGGAAAAQQQLSVLFSRDGALRRRCPLRQVCDGLPVVFHRKRCKKRAVPAAFGGGVPEHKGICHHNIRGENVLFTAAFPTASARSEQNDAHQTEAFLQWAGDFSNISVVKLVDFGEARTFATQQSSSSLAASPRGQQHRDKNMNSAHKNGKQNRAGSQTESVRPGGVFYMAPEMLGTGQFSGKAMGIRSTSGLLGFSAS